MPRESLLAPPRGCPRNGKPVRFAHVATVRQGREGGRTRPASPETGLHPVRDARRSVRPGDPECFAARPPGRARSPVATRRAGLRGLRGDRHGPCTDWRARGDAGPFVSGLCGRGARLAAVATIAVPFSSRRRRNRRGPPIPAALEPVAVTASRQTQPIADVLADLTVIGPDEIARAGVQSLTELLQRQPGVEIVQNGGPGSVSGIFLRGANRGQTLVLIDGVRIASSSAGATSLEAIPLDQIERIEILRGPASSLYGADAIGGVVQVFTRRGGERRSPANASAGYGTYATWDAKAGVAGSAGPAQFAVQAAGEGEPRLQHDHQSGQFSLQPGSRRLLEPERVGESRDARSRRSRS